MATTNCRKKEVKRLMTKTNIIETILSTFEDAAMVRNTGNNTNFIAVPMEDGKYASIKVGVLPDHDVECKNGTVRVAYDHTAAIDAYVSYKEQKAKEAEEREIAKANKPKVSRVDPEKAAVRKARQDAMMEYVKTIPGVQFTSTELVGALEEVYPNNDVLTAGTDLSAVAKEDSALTFTKVKGKKYWVYNG